MNRDHFVFRAPLLGLLWIAGVTLPAIGQLEARSQPASPEPIYVVTADFNHDGKMDLAVGTAGAGDSPNEVQILLGNGDGTFGPPTTYDANGAYVSLAVGDFNGDGNADLAVLQPNPGFVSVLLGNGDGTFQTPVVYDAPAPPYALALGDFNGDGNLDIAVSLNDSATMQCTCIGVLLGNGTGAFPEAWVITPLPTGAGPITTGHFGRSKNLDLAAVVATTLSSEAVEILLGNGDGTFTVGNSYPLLAQDTNSIIAADFRKNGKTDVAVPEGAGVAVFLGNGDDTLDEAVVYDLAFAWGAAAADMNGDGIPDLIATTTGVNPGAVGIFYGNGDGTFKNVDLFPTGDFPNGIAVADFNGDRKVDVATADRFSASTAILLNTGVVSFSPASPVTFPTQLVGTTSGPLTTTLINKGTSPLEIASVTLRGKPFTMQTTCGKSVAPHGTCSIPATFTPTEQDLNSGTVGIEDSASSKPMVAGGSRTGNCKATTRGRCIARYRIEAEHQPKHRAWHVCCCQKEDQLGTKSTLGNAEVRRSTG